MGEMGSYRERGGCLSAFLVFAMFIGGLRLLGGLLASGSATGDEQLHWLGVAVIGGVGLVLAWQVWRWQRWAVHAWFAVCVIGAILSIAREDWPWAAGQVVGGLLFGALIAGNWSGFGDPPREPEPVRDDQDEEDDEPELIARPVPLPPRQLASPKPAVRADERACPHCNAAVPLDAKFCDACGRSLTNECPKCGAGNRAEARFCKQCGAGLSPPEPPVQAAAAAASPEPEEEPAAESREAVPVDRLILCSSCGAKNRPTEWRCRRCMKVLRNPR